MLIKSKQFLTSLALVMLVIVSVDPLGWYYSYMTSFTIVALLVAAFAAFQVLIWKEVLRDEREEYHEKQAGKVAYTLGTFVLLLGIVVQIFEHDVDVWLVAALLVMIFGKMISCFYIDRVN